VSKLHDLFVVCWGGMANKSNGRVASHKT